jgi:hypothetical protein
MGLFNPGSGTGDVRSKAQRLDMLLGIIGFFTFMAVVQLVLLEVRGEPAVGAAVLAAVLVAALWLTWRARRNTGV